MYLKKKTIFFIFFLISILQHNIAEEEKEEYKFILDKLEKIVESDEILTTNISFDKQGDNVVVNGEVEQKMDFDNDWQLNMTIYRSDEADGEYKKLLALPDKGVCDAMKSYYKMYFYQTLKNHANAPDPENCPVTKETYVIKDYPLDSSKFKKILKPGYYRVTSTLLNNKVEKLKYELYGHVEEVQ